MADILDYSDSFKLYCRDVRGIPLLTDEEEIELSKRISNGDKGAQMELVEHNLRLVISEAKKYLYRGLSYQDLIQEGNLGLMEAAERYDSSLGRFSTYAVVRIRKSIIRAIYNYGRVIRIPVHFWTTINRFKNVFKELSDSLGRKPNIDEIAKVMHVSVENVQLIIQSMQVIDSLNQFAFDDSDKELISSVGCFDKESNDLNKQINKLLNKSGLDRREKYVIDGFFGFIGNDCKTLVQLGQELHISYEMVRIIKNDALNKIRDNNQLEELIPYTQNPTLSSVKVKNYRETGNMDYSERELLLLEINDYPELYDYFDGYSKKEVNVALENLTNSELSSICRHLRNHLYVDKVYRELINKIRAGLKLQRNDQYENLDEYEILIKAMDNPSALSEIEQQVVVFKIGQLQNAYIAKQLGIGEIDVENIIKNLGNKVESVRA